MEENKLINISTKNIAGNNLSLSINYFFKKIYLRNMTSVLLFGLSILHITLVCITILMGGSGPDNANADVNTLTSLFSVIAFESTFFLFINSVIVFKSIKNSIIYQKILTSEYSGKELLVTFAIINYIFLIVEILLFSTPILIIWIFASGFNFHSFPTILSFFGAAFFISIFLSLLSTSFSVMMSSTKYSLGSILVIFVFMLLTHLILSEIWHVIVLISESIGKPFSDNWLNSLDDSGHLNPIGYINVIVLIITNPFLLLISFSQYLVNVYDGYYSVYPLLYVILATTIIWTIESVAFFFLGINFLEKEKR